MRKFPGPVIIISPPRSRADLLLRMLRSDGMPSANADGLVEKLATIGNSSSIVWQDAILGNLREAAVSPDNNFALVDRISGNGGWESARKLWSWLLDVVPSLTIVFLTRDHVKTAASLEAAWSAWVPRYGKCASSCERHLASHLESIATFSQLRPDRCIVVDSDDLLSFTKKPEWISEEAWSKEVTIRTHTVDTLEAPPVDEDLEEMLKFAPARLKRKEDDLFPHTPPPKVAAPPPRKYMLEVEDVPRAKSLEVHTLRFGDADWISECAPALEGWCSRHGYPLKVHGRDESLPDEKFGTLQMIREFLAGDADTMLFVDADVFPHPQAPAFPALPGFAAYIETFGRVLKNWKQWDGFVPGWKYRNSGVWSCDRETAAIFLAETESGPWEIGYREQHQFNAWWAAASGKGMVMSDLPVDWNRLSKVQKTEMAPAWFFHLNGPDKLRTLRNLRDERMLPPPAKTFDCPERTGIDRAICYPWIAGKATWEEIRFSLRSVEKHFKDTKCPIYILGPDRPTWLAEHPRLQHIFIDYSSGRERGLYDAFRIGLTIADSVLWMNDDEILVKPVGWEDFAEAVTEGQLDAKVDELLSHGNRWRAGMANAAIDLRHHGHEGPVMRFATHTPFLFEREKSIEIFQRFHLPFKGGWANLYHNWHRTPHKPIGRIKTHSLSPRHVKPETLFLNYRDNTLTGLLKRQIEEMFPEPAAWENDKPASSLLPYFGAGAVVWPWKSDEAEYDELWFSSQSVRKHFSEKDWVHVLLGDEKPAWWTGEFVHAPRYEEALFAGAQCADRVLWMNDDIFMTGDQSPDDFAKARVSGSKKTKEQFAASDNVWEQNLGSIMMGLEQRGLRATNFETHTPYLFERDKVRAAFDLFPPTIRRFPFATVYHNVHATPSAKLTERAKNPEDMDGKLWINPQTSQITPEFIAELENRFGKPPQKI